MNNGCDQAAADWLWTAGAANYIALAFGDYYHQRFADVPERGRPTYATATNGFWYAPDGIAARHKRGQEIDTWPGKYTGTPPPTTQGERA